MPAKLKNPVVPGSEDAGPDFEIRDELTIYEGAMVCAGRHPAGQFLKDGTLDDRLAFLKAGLSQGPLRPGRPEAQLAWDVFCEVNRRVERGEIRPAKPPHYLPSGRIDPVHTLIRAADLATLAVERGEKPTYLAHLLQGQARPPKPGGARARREASVTAELHRGATPGGTVSWNQFCDTVRDCAGGWKDRAEGLVKRGFSAKSIERTARSQMMRMGQDGAPGAFV
jgi:hypothetical protein